MIATFKTLRHKLLYVIIFLGILFSLPSATHAAVTTSPGSNTGLAGYWSLNEGVGTIAHDFSGNGNMGTLTNSPTWTLGKLNKALNFNSASSQYVTIPNASSLDLASGNMTISTWFFANSYGSFATLFKKGISGNRDYAFYINSPTTAWLAMGNESGGSVTFTGTKRFTIGVWHHLVITKSGTSAVGYLDGEQAFTKTVSTNSDSGSALEIGKPDVSNSYWNGKIDEFRIYNRALSAAEIVSLYHTSGLTLKTPPKSGSVAYWSFNDQSSTKAHDFSGFGNNATLSGASGSGLPTWIAGKRASAIHFDGVDDEGDVPQTSSINLSNNGSISVWVKPDTTNDGDIFQSGLGVNGAMTVWMAGSLGNQVWFGRQQNGPDDWAHSSTQFVPGQWIHIVGVMNSGVETIYINGVAEGTSINNGSFTNGATYLIGKGDDGNFLGTIDDMRIYNRPLSATEAMALYRQGEVQINGSQNNKSTNGLVGLWSFNGSDVSASTAFDRINGNNGTLTNGPKPTIGKLGQAIALDGVDDYVEVGDVSAANMGTGNFTVSVWAKTNSGSPQSLLAKRTTSTSNRGYTMWLSGNKFYFTLDDGSTKAEDFYTSSAVNDNKWHLYSVTVDRASNIQWYLDGSLVKSLSDTSVTGTVSSTNSLVLGAFSSHALSFKGSLDEVRIYNKALSDAEIRQLYLMGK